MVFRGVKCHDWTLQWPVFMVLFVTVFFRGAGRGFFFLFEGWSGCWATHLQLIGLSAPALPPRASLIVASSSGNLFSYTCQRSNPVSSPIPVWSHHFCGPAPRPLATQPLQLCHPAQPWLHELANCVTLSLPMKHLPAPELTTSTFLLFHHVQKFTFEPAACFGVNFWVHLYTTMNF